MPEIKGKLAITDFYSIIFEEETVSIDKVVYDKVQESFDFLKEFSKIFDVSSTLDKNDLGEHAGFLFFHIVRKLYKSSIEQLQVIDAELEEIEENVFQNKEEKMVRIISELNRKLLDFKQAINVHEGILRSFEYAAAVLFGEEFKYYLSDITGEYRRVRTTLESHKDVLQDLKETNDALLTNKTNY